VLIRRLNWSQAVKHAHGALPQNVGGGFTNMVSDGGLYSNIGTVSLTITAVNPAAVATDASVALSTTACHQHQLAKSMRYTS